MKRKVSRGNRGKLNTKKRTKHWSADAEILRDLRELGFTEYEAKAYLTLLAISPATAYEVSKIAGLPKANVYTAIQSLASQGAVQPVSAEPVRYAALEPVVVFGQIAKTTDERCQQVARQLASRTHAHPTEHVWTINGEREIHDKIADMINSAQRHVWLKGPKRLLQGHIEELRNASIKGVGILIVLFGSESDLQEFQFGGRSRTYLHEGSGMMMGLGDQLVTVATDFTEALTANTGEPGFGAYTKSPPVVYTVESLIRHEVYLAEIFSRFRGEIQKEFGPALLKLREQFLPKQQVHALKRSIAKS